MLLRLISTLRLLATSLTGARTLEELATAVEQMLLRLFPVEYSALYFFDPALGRLRLLCATGFTEEERIEAENTAMERHPGRVYSTGTILHIPDVERDSEHLSESSPRSFIVRSRLYVPVMLGQRCIGAIGIVGSTPKVYSDFEITALSLLGDLAAVAYDRIREQSERQAMEAELALRDHAITSSNNGIIITDATLPDNPVVYVNPAFERMTGYSSEETLGRNCRFLQGEDRDQPGLVELRAALKEQKACHVVLRNFRKDHTPFWTELSISPVLDASGKATRYIGIQSDVTGRIEAAEELRTTAARLSRLIENLHAAVLVEDAARRIALVNQNFCSLFGIPVAPEHLIGSDCSQAAEQSKGLFSDPVAFVARIEDLLRRREPEIGDELEMTDGRFLERDFVPITLDGEYLGQLWQYRDITHRVNTTRQLEAAVARNRELLAIAEDALAAREQFFARMSHEIRTPLNGVIGLSHVLRDSGLSEQQLGIVDHLQQSADNLLVIVNDILDLSKIAAGKLAIVPKEFSVRGVLTTTLESVRPRASARGLALELHLGEDLPEVLIGDPVRLSQIMLNIASNAVKFTERGSVRIACDVEERSNDSTRLMLRCTDTGIGIAAEDLPLLFESYQQLHDSGHEGTGLGLAITKHLVELMGGSIEVGSTLGEGTTVTVHLPFGNAAATATIATEPIARAAATLRGLRMLVVDDNAMNRLVVSTMLGNEGAEIIEAASGAEALARVAEREPDAIFMDLRMPGMDGIETTRLIRSSANASTARIPIVAMTASITPDQQRQCVEAGMDGFIPKPFAPSLLHETVARLFPSGAPVAAAGGQAPLPPTTGATSSVTEIDLSYFESMAGGDAGFLRTALETLQRNLKTLSESVADAAAGNDAEALRSAAHQMRSMFSMVGLAATAGLCATIEETCIAGSLPARDLTESLCSTSSEVLLQLATILTRDLP